MYPTASLSISELLSGPYLLNIPIYQRPYSWGREQAEQLLDDLMEASGLGSDGLADPILFSRHRSSDGRTGHGDDEALAQDVGARVRRHRRPAAPRHIDDLVRGSSRSRDRSRRSRFRSACRPCCVAQQGTRFFRTERFRLHLASRDRTVFEDNILQAGSVLLPPDNFALSLSEATLLDVRDLYRSTLAELSEATRKVLADFIADHCFVVVVVGHDIDKAHQMFVVLNERGKKLQRNDILKSDILSRMTNADAVWAGRMWDDTSLALGDGFEPFFGHLRTIYGYGRLQIVSGVRTVIREAGGSEPFFKDVFLPLAKAYTLVRSSGDGVLPADMTRILNYLNRLPDADWAPAAILALKDWQEESGPYGLSSGRDRAARKSDAALVRRVRQARSPLCRPHQGNRFRRADRQDPSGLADVARGSPQHRLSSQRLPQAQPESVQASLVAPRR